MIFNPYLYSLDEYTSFILKVSNGYRGTHKAEVKWIKKHKHNFRFLLDIHFSIRTPK